MGLQEYIAKRNFKVTSEPKGTVQKKDTHIFVIQRHEASILHFDFRLEVNGVLRSWSVPKGPPTTPKDKRLAVETEDHPVSYAKFSGDIPEGEYGAGHMDIWDHGTWQPEGNAAEQLRKGHLNFTLKGERLQGRWTLIRTKQTGKKPNWLLIKRTDDISIEPTKKNKSEKKKSIKPIAVKTIPKFVEPELCELVSEAPVGDKWLHEIKFDGYRVFARKDKTKLSLLTRRGNDWSHRFPTIFRECKKLKARSVIVDGEIAWVDENGMSHFNGLQNSMEKETDELIYYLFDILFLDGKDLRQLPLIERKEILKDLIERSKTKLILYSDHQVAEGSEVVAQACKIGLEGIVSKRADSPYVSGRSDNWVKTKCKNIQEFVIGGYTLQKERPVLGALLVGEYDDKGELQYVGKIGTGFSKNNIPELSYKLKKSETKKCPFKKNPPGYKHAIWVKPQLVANIEFGAWTEDHILRHAAFKGLREDKPAKEVVTEMKLKKSTEVNLTHPDKVIFSDLGIRKIDIVEYYQTIQDYILPHVKNRPLALLRCPSGQGQSCFFQKHLDDEKSVIHITNIEQLLELVQINALEIHMWNSRINQIENPDQIVFDLDPDPTVTWKDVKTAALRLKEILEQLELKSFLKISGNKGLHLHVPIQPRYTWDEIKNFSRSVCSALVEQYPDLYTVNILKKDRKNKIFLDYLRNSDGATAVCPYSLRNNPKATVALPIAWTDLGKLKAPDAISIKNALKLIKSRKDPWADYFKHKQKIRLLDISKQALKPHTESRR